MQAGKSSIKDASDFLNKLMDLGDVPENDILVTADVVRLYPSIPHVDGLQALFKALEKRENKSVPSRDLVQMAEFVLKNNFFEFNDDSFHQIAGTAIGTKFAPPYACIFMDELETDFLAAQPVQPWVWYRYIDDVFFIWTGSEEELSMFLERLNQFHPSIKFTHEKSRQSLAFLDVSVSVVDGKFQTDLYTKKTDCHQYIHFESCHPRHTKTSCVYSQGLRLRRLCSDDNAFKSRLSEMEKWFLSRGYPLSIIKQQFARLENISQAVALTPKERAKNEVGVPFVVTYNPRFNSLSKTINERLPTLYSDSELKRVFTPKPFVSFRSVRPLKGHLVRSKLYPLERATGSSRCRGVNCGTCKYVKETDLFSSNVTDTSYQINHRLNCNSKCVIYLLRCKVCNIQYVGQTSDKFRYRWNNYTSCHRRAKNGQSVPQMSLHSHFLREDHNGLFEDAELTFIDKTDPSDPRKRERFWIDLLETKPPKGLNEGENV